jgi:hypothetical protein
VPITTAIDNRTYRALSGYFSRRVARPTEKSSANGGKGIADLSRLANESRVLPRAIEAITLFSHRIYNFARTIIKFERNGELSWIICFSMAPVYTF